MLIKRKVCANIMNSVNSSNLSFGSTKLPRFCNHDKIVKKLNEFAEVIHLDNTSKTSQEIADSLNFGQVAYVFDGKSFRIVGKDGGQRGVDTYVGKQIKEIIPDATYVDDVKPLDKPKLNLDI